MKVKDGFVLRKIANSDMVIPIGNNIADFNGVISLNDSAAFLWKQLSEEVSMSELTEVLMQEYDISRETAQKDTESFIRQLQQRNMLEQYI